MSESEADQAALNAWPPAVYSSFDTLPDRRVRKVYVQDTGNVKGYIFVYEKDGVVDDVEYAVH